MFTQTKSVLLLHFPGCLSSWSVRVIVCVSHLCCCFPEESKSLRLILSSTKSFHTGTHFEICLFNMFNSVKEVVLFISDRLVYLGNILMSEHLYIPLLHFSVSLLLLLLLPLCLQSMLINLLIHVLNQRIKIFLQRSVVAML